MKVGTVLRFHARKMQTYVVDDFLHSGNRLLGPVLRHRGESLELERGDFENIATLGHP